MNEAKKIIEGLALPVIAVNANLEILAVNSLADHAFDGIGHEGGFADFLERVDGLKEHLKSTLESGQPSKTKVKPKAGYRSDYTVTIKNIGTLGGHASPVALMTFEDRTLSNDLKTMRVEFVANVSHEIRSPLTAISGFVETLQGPAVEDVAVRTRFLDLMGREVTRMTNLVSDLLSLSQVEAKQRRSLKNKVEIGSVIDQALSTVSATAKKHQKTLIADIAPKLPDVMGRQDDLIRVLINLLENAIHYSRQGGEINLTARVERDGNPLGQDALMIAIKDDGDGIAAAEIPNLTQRFYRVDKSRSRNLGGTGLGLAIVKHILVRHRGELVIDSVLGQGSTFTIYLPLAAAD